MGSNQKLEVVGHRIRCECPEAGPAVLAMLQKRAMHCLCDGRDGCFSIGAVKRVQVWRVENPVLWKQYCNKAQEMRERSQMFSSACPPLTPAIADLDMILPECLQQQQFNESLNEVLLFHGTKSGNVEQIAEEGFDER